jgi:hypothetical protein
LRCSSSKKIESLLVRNLRNQCKSSDLHIDFNNYYKRLSELPTISHITSGESLASSTNPQIKHPYTNMDIFQVNCVGIYLIEKVCHSDKKEPTIHRTQANFLDIVRSAFTSTASVNIVIATGVVLLEWFC